MKKIFPIYLLLVFIIINTSCKKKEVDKLTEFDINYSSNLTIPSSSMTVSSSSLMPTTVDFITPNIPTQQSSKFSSEKTAQYLIDIIKMVKFDISANGSGANLDFLKSLTIYIKAANMPEQIVATKTSIPTGLTAIALDVQDVNIKNFIFEDNIQFRVQVIFDAVTATNQTLKLDQTVHVKATLLK